MRISDEAVEAAANELYGREGYYTPLADAPAPRRERFRTEAREILEAAAPHMLREAQAVALEEAADALVERGDYIRKISADTSMYVTALAIYDGNERAAAYLRARAVTLRGGE